MRAFKVFTPAFFCILSGCFADPDRLLDECNLELDVNGIVTATTAIRVEFSQGKAPVRVLVPRPDGDELSLYVRKLPPADYQVRVQTFRGDEQTGCAWAMIPVTKTKTHAEMTMAESCVRPDVSLDARVSDDLGADQGRPMPDAGVAQPDLSQSLDMMVRDIAPIDSGGQPRLDARTPMPDMQAPMPDLDAGLSDPDDGTGSSGRGDRDARADEGVEDEGIEDEEIEDEGIEDEGVDDDSGRRGRGRGRGGDDQG